jgi:phytoene desaturase
MNDFIDRNIDSPFNLLTPNLARLIALGGFRRLSPKVNQFMKDPRLQKVYSFQAMYAGVSPQQALAIYAVIAYMDSVNGVFFPKGGMHAVPRALAAAAQKHGVEFKYDTTVSKIEIINGRAILIFQLPGAIYWERFRSQSSGLTIPHHVSLCWLAHLRNMSLPPITTFTLESLGMACLMS